MLFDKLIEKRVAAFEKEIMQNYYREVEQMYTKMRGWRHDYRHHIQAMNTMQPMESMRKSTSTWICWTMI